MSESTGIKFKLAVRQLQSFIAEIDRVGVSLIEVGKRLVELERAYFYDPYLFDRNADA